MLVRIRLDFRVGFGELVLVFFLGFVCGRGLGVGVVGVSL